MQTDICPESDHLVIAPAEPITQSRGGILIPEIAQERTAKGVVLAVGPGRIKDNGERTTMTVKVGDLVLYGKYSGTQIEEDEKQLLIIREADILGVMRPKSKLHGKAS